jgi:hypothetical protein
MLPPVIVFVAAVNWVVDVVTWTERPVAAFAFHNVYVIVSAPGPADVGTAVALILSKVQAAGITIWNSAKAPGVLWSIPDALEPESGKIKTALLVAGFVKKPDVNTVPAPAAPVGPVAPMDPLVPLVPLTPAAPVAPVAPVEPELANVTSN